MLEGDRLMSRFSPPVEAYGHSTFLERALIVSYTDAAVAKLITARANTYSLVRMGGLRKTTININEVTRNIE